MRYLRYTLCFAAGLLLGALFLEANAHTPCNDNDWQQPKPPCRYEQKYDPYTGQFKSEYICP